MMLGTISLVWLPHRIQSSPAGASTVGREDGGFINHSFLDCLLSVHKVYETFVCVHVSVCHLCS